jgi:hypothetical protein
MWPDLADVLQDIPWAVVGAVATRMYMPERATVDLDIAISASNGERARSRLLASGWRNSGPLSMGGYSWTGPEGSQVDSLELTDSWAAEALQQTQRTRDAQGLPVFSLPYLALMKFQVSLVQDVADVTRMLGLASEGDLAAVRKLFSDLPADDQADLEAMISLGKLETGSA